jgi:hypothetical protein
VKIIKDSFKAWIDKQPVGPNKLIVIGEVEVPTGGWNVILSPASPQGINPNVIILEIKATPPSGNVIQVITTIPLRYEESPPKHPYTDATIRSPGDEFTIAVQQVQ